MNKNYKLALKISAQMQKYKALAGVVNLEGAYYRYAVYYYNLEDQKEDKEDNYI